MCIPPNNTATLLWHHYFGNGISGFITESAFVLLLDLVIFKDLHIS